jgi:hypothetical protein
MAFEEAIKAISVDAAGDLSASQHCFLVLDSNGRVAVAGAAARAFGVLRNKPAGLGHAATVVREGTVKVKAGAALAKGDLVTTDASGRAVEATTGNPVLGRVLGNATTAANQFTSVELALQGEPNAA